VKDHHFFVTTAFLWNAGEDLYELLTKSHERHGKAAAGTAYAVYRVPAPLSEPYEIRDYRPMGPGAVLIAEGVWAAPGPRAGRAK
jgi:hypothetical protein